MAGPDSVASWRWCYSGTAGPENVPLPPRPDGRRKKSRDTDEDLVEVERAEREGRNAAAGEKARGPQDEALSARVRVAVFVIKAEQQSAEEQGEPRDIDRVVDHGPRS